MFRPLPSACFGLKARKSCSPGTTSTFCGPPSSGESPSPTFFRAQWRVHRQNHPLAFSNPLETPWDHVCLFFPPPSLELSHCHLKGHVYNYTFWAILSWGEVKNESRSFSWITLTAEFFHTVNHYEPIGGEDNYDWCKAVPNFPFHKGETITPFPHGGVWRFNHNGSYVFIDFIDTTMII